MLKRVDEKRRALVKTGSTAVAKDFYKWLAKGRKIKTYKAIDKMRDHRLG